MNKNKIIAKATIQFLDKMAKMHYAIESAKFIYNPFVEQNQQQQIKVITTKDNVF